MLVELRKEPEAHAIGSLADAFRALGGHLSPDDGSAAVRVLLERVRQCGDPRLLYGPEHALESVARALSPEGAQEVYDLLVGELDPEAEYHVEALSPGLSAAAAALPADRVGAAFDDALRVLEESAASRPPEAAAPDSCRREVMERVAAGALLALSTRLDPGGREVRRDQLVHALGLTQSALAARSIAEALVSPLGESSPAQSRSALARLLQLMEGKQSSPWELTELAEGLRAVPGELTREEAATAVQIALSGIRRPIGGGKAAVAIAARLTPAQANDAYVSIAAAMLDCKDRGQVIALGAMLEAVPGQLSVELTRAAGAQLANVVFQSTDSQFEVGIWSSSGLEEYARWEDAHLLSALCSAAKRLTGEDAVAMQGRLVASLEETDAVYQCPFLAAAVVSLRIPLDPERLSAAALRMLKPFKGDHDLFGGARLESFSILAAALRTEDAGPVFLRLGLVIDRAWATSQFEPMEGGLSAFAGNVDAQTLIDFLKWPSCADRVRARTLSLLEERTGQSFGGNVWRAVSWAQANGLDVATPPQRPKQ